MNKIAKNVINKLFYNKLKISIAESCSGGLLSGTITSVSGSSKVFNLGLIAYSNECKIKILKVSKKLIKKYGAVSEEVCKAMVINISKIGKTKMSLAITGIAGPRGGTRKKPVGLVYIGFKKDREIKIKKYLFMGKKRSQIQKSAVNKSLKLILSFLK